MRTDKLTTTFQTVLQDAQSLAVQNSHQMMEPAHVLLAMLQHQGSGVYNVYANAGIDVEKLISQLQQQLDAMNMASRKRKQQIEV